MDYEVMHVSRGHIDLKHGDRRVRVLGEGLLPSNPCEPGFVVYLNSLCDWEDPSKAALTEPEKQQVIEEIKRYFDSRGTIVEFE